MQHYMLVRLIYLSVVLLNTYHIVFEMFKIRYNLHFFYWTGLFLYIHVCYCFRLFKPAYYFFLAFNLLLNCVYRRSYYGVKKNQLDVQFFLSIFRQPLHVSGVHRPIIRR